MARIGDYIQPGLNHYDPSPYLAAQANATRTIGAGISDAIGNFSDAMDERKKKKESIKVSSELLDAYATLNPQHAETFASYRDKLKDEEIPLSERAAMGDQIGALIGMDQERQKRDTQISQFAQQHALDLQESNLRNDSGRFELDAAKEDRGTAKQSLADSEEVKGLIAPNVLENVIMQTKALEQAGQQVMIPSAQLQQVLQTGTTQQKMQMAQAAMSAFPQDAPAEFRDIPITMNGQPGTATAAYNRKTGTFDIVPVREAGSLSLSGPLAQYAADFEAAGAKSGVDPRLLAAIAIHETGNGTSDAFRNKSNAMGISNSKGPTAQPSVGASIEKMAGLLGSTTSGPYKNADTIAEIAGIYAPPGAGNDPRGLNKHWVEGVAKYYKELGGDPSASVKVAPGAVKTTVRGRTPTQEKLDQANLAVAEQQVITKEREVADAQKAKNSTLAEASQSIKLLEQLEKHPGFEDVFGVHLGGRWIPSNDGVGADKLFEQVKNRGFLDSIEKIRGTGSLSNAEGEKLMNAANRLDRKLSEKEAKQVIDEMKAQLKAHIERLQKAGAEGSAVAPVKSAAEKLREARASLGN